ncbi:MAG: hypothetical protein WCP11_03030 [Candidatus Saccharibacteria bacterium]
MQWIIILVVIALGYFLVKSINRNTRANLLIEQNRTINTEEYRNLSHATQEYGRRLLEAEEMNCELFNSFVDLLKDDKLTNKQAAQKMADIKNDMDLKVHAMWKEQTRLQKLLKVHSRIDTSPFLAELEETRKLTKEAFNKYKSQYLDGAVGFYDIEKKRYRTAKECGYLPYSQIDVVTKQETKLLSVNR